MSDSSLAGIDGVAEAFILFGLFKVDGVDGVVNVDTDDGVNGVLGIVVFIGIVCLFCYSLTVARQDVSCSFILLLASGDQTYACPLIFDHISRLPESSV